MTDLKGLDDLIKDIEKTFGKGSVFIGDQGSNAGIERWAVEDLVLNDGFGGGIPKARFIEVYGPEGSGKTSIACYLAAQVQKQGGMIGYIDAEQAIDFQYAKTFGLDLNKCLFNQPDCGEDGLDVVQKMVESNQIDLVVVDSVAALTPKAEIEAGMSDQQMGLQARMMSKACRKLAALCNKTNTAIIWVNQIRMRMGGYGNPEVTTSGLALRYFSSVRIEVRKKEAVEVGTNDDKKMIGQISKVKFVKNKTATPMKFGEIKILFGKGVQVEEEVIDYALSLGVLQRKGTWYFFGEEKLGQGKDKAVELFKTDPKWAEKIKKETMLRMSKPNILSTEIIVEDKSLEELSDAEIVEEIDTSILNNISEGDIDALPDQEAIKLAEKLIEDNKKELSKERKPRKTESEVIDLSDIEKK